MTCLVVLTKEIISSNGASHTLLSTVLTSTEYETYENSLNAVGLNLDFDNKEIHKMMDRTKSFNHEYLASLYKIPHLRLMKKLSKLKYLTNDKGQTIIHELANLGYKFSVNDLVEIGNPSDNFGITVAHFMVNKTFKFSVSELLAIGNPSDKRGNTVAHWIADYDYGSFTVDELMQLGNPSNKQGETISHLMAERLHVFSIDELLILGNPADNSDFTVAHQMAWKGYKFTEHEIDKLGNPIDINGQTIMDIMKQFTPERNMGFVSTITKGA